MRALSQNSSFIAGKAVHAMLVCLMATVLSAGARAEVQNPQAVVQDLSDKLIVLIEASRETFSEDPAAFHAEMKALMEPVVAFSYIAKNVMGANYFKQASAGQFERFTNNFESSLIETYAKGFFTYNGEEIVVHPAEQDYQQEKTVVVLQEIKTESGVNIAYTMKINKSGEWKLTNMVVNGVNLGQVLRNQFQQAMEQNGDLDAVIDAWPGNTTSAESEEDDSETL